MATPATSSRNRDRGIAFQGVYLRMWSGTRPSSLEGNFCGVVDFGDMCAGDPACDLAACWMLLPNGVIDRFYQSYSPAADAATQRRARGWTVWKALAGLLIGDNGIHGRPGGNATWAPSAGAALQSLSATRLEGVRIE